MDRRNLENVVHHFCKKLEDAQARIAAGFGVEDIHQFRVEVKKLRAYLRLVATQGAPLGDIFPAPLKDFYQHLGQIRTIQLTREKLKHLEHDTSVLEVIITRLADEEEMFQQSGHDWSARVQLQGYELIWTSWLPEYLSDKKIQRFVNYKLASIRLCLLDIYSEDNLHQVRKELKDLLYVVKIFRNAWGIPFPVDWPVDVDSMTRMADSLGQYNDFRTWRTLLQSHEQFLPTTELEIVHHLLRQWEIEQADLFKSLLPDLEWMAHHFRKY